ncbi:MAG: hypothetical protein FJ137_20170 [Deltaproteobacteria bacterium]|nr:hypothetical protein [Deltaproteobacteria bacterium]
MAKKQRAEDAQVRSERRGGERLLEPTLAHVDALAADAVVIGLCSDVRPLAGVLGIIDWRLCGRVSRLVERGVITGAAGEQILMPTLGRIPAPRLFLVGWGRAAILAEQAEARVHATLAMLDKAHQQRVAFAFPEPAGDLLSWTDHVERHLGERLVGVFGADPVGAL